MTEFRPREVDTELRYVIPIGSPEGTEYLVAVAMRGASLLEPFSNSTVLGPFVEFLVGRIQVTLGARSTVRKVGVFERKRPWSRARCRFKTWASTAEDADDLALRICDELERGIRRWH